jgi:serine/threonine-protein kinase
VTKIADLAEGATFAGFVVVRKLSQGGMGSVYQVTQVSTGRQRALKLMHPEIADNGDLRGKFVREARLGSSIESDHVVEVVDAGVDGETGIPWLAMELLQGEDLGGLIQRVGRLEPIDVFSIFEQLTHAVGAAHAAGIVHRDLKPDNVLLVEREGDRAFVKIVDFGTSKIQPLSGKTTPLSLTRRGVAVGTPLYMSPEQAEARDDVDERSDLYSVGALAFECLTGRPPHVGETDDDVVASICTRDAPIVRSLAPATPERVAAFVDKALARDRAERFLSARQMLDALTVALAAPSSGVTPSSKRASKRRGSVSPPLSGWTWLAAFGAALSGVVATVWVAPRLGGSASSGSAAAPTAGSVATTTSSSAAAADASTPGTSPPGSSAAQGSP